MSSTLNDIAELAGVSTATVSRVVNGSVNVSVETRGKVLSAISKLQYLPNAHASQLARTNRNVSKRRGDSLSISAHAGRQTLSKRRFIREMTVMQAEQFRWLEETHAQLLQTAFHLSSDMERLRSILNSVNMSSLL